MKKIAKLDRIKEKIELFPLKSMDKQAVGKLKDIYNTIVHNYQDLDEQAKENGKWRGLLYTW